MDGKDALYTVVYNASLPSLVIIEMIILCNKGSLFFMPLRLNYSTEYHETLRTCFK